MKKIKFTRNLCIKNKFLWCHILLYIIHTFVYNFNGGGSLTLLGTPIKGRCFKLVGPHH